HRARLGEQRPADAALQPVVVAMQDVPPSMPLEHRLLLLRQLHGDGPALHLAHGEREALHELFDHGATPCTFESIGTCVLRSELRSSSSRCCAIIALALAP